MTSLNVTSFSPVPQCFSGGATEPYLELKPQLKKHSSGPGARHFYSDFTSLDTVV